MSNNNEQILAFERGKQKVKVISSRSNLGLNDGDEEPLYDEGLNDHLLSIQEASNSPKKSSRSSSKGKGKATFNHISNDLNLDRTHSSPQSSAVTVSEVISKELNTGGSSRSSDVSPFQGSEEINLGNSDISTFSDSSSSSSTPPSSTSVNNLNRFIDPLLLSSQASSPPSELTSPQLETLSSSTFPTIIDINNLNTIPPIRTKPFRSMNRIRSNSYSTPSNSNLIDSNFNNNFVNNRLNNFNNNNQNNNLINQSNLNTNDTLTSNSSRYLDRESHWLSEDEADVGPSSRSRRNNSNNNINRESNNFQDNNRNNVKASSGLSAIFTSTTHNSHQIHHRPSLIRASTEPTTPTLEFMTTSNSLLNSNSTSPTFDQLLPNLLTLLTCKKCSTILTAPTTLPCGHTQCLNCVSTISDLSDQTLLTSSSNLSESKKVIIKCYHNGCNGKGGNKSSRSGRIKNTNLTSNGGETKVDFVLNKVLGVLSNASTVSSFINLDGETLAMQGVESRISSEVPQILSQKIDLSSSSNTLLELQSELECQVCVQLYYNPITTPCGHTYCQKCLARSLDHSDKCSICRSSMPSFTYFLTQPINKTTSNIISLLFPTILSERKLTVEAEEHSNSFDIPIFVCTLAWPNLPTYIHIFEPRYRLMMRRVMESPRRQFGMVLPARTEGGGIGGMSEYGTMLEVQSWNMIEDGRSIVETIGTYRFRLLEKDTLDGYTVGKVERVDDISDEQEAELERIALARNPTILPIGITTSNTRRRGSLFSRNSSPPLQPTFISQSPSTSTSNSTSPSTGVSSTSPSTTSSATPSSNISPGSSSNQASNSTTSSAVPPIELSTEQLMTICLEFIQTLRSGSAPWVLQRLNNTIGPMPTNPSDFSFWMAEVMPVDDHVKSALLQITSPRERLRLLVFWIDQFKRSWWFEKGCSVM